MAIRVIVDRDEERKFRRRALRRMPNEYMELLFGKVKGDAYVIYAFVDIEHESTPTYLTFDLEERERHKQIAKKSGLELLGSIHTHPFRDKSLYSELDAWGSFNSDERIMGICGIEVEEGKKRKCHIDYWPQVLPLEVDYLYMFKPDDCSGQVTS